MNRFESVRERIGAVLGGACDYACPIVQAGREMGRRSCAHSGHRVCLLTIGWGAVWIAGCGNDRPTTIPVSGRVTLDKGNWPTSGTLFFLPMEPASGYPRRPATAEFAEDGSFGSATSWQDGDGVVPGRYKVYVECWKIRPTRAGPPPQSYAATKYQAGATSDIEVDVAADSGDQQFEWNIPKGP